jgi:hypothetical protein
VATKTRADNQPSIDWSAAGATIYALGATGFWRIDAATGAREQVGYGWRRWARSAGSIAEATELSTIDFTFRCYTSQLYAINIQLCTPRAFSVTVTG